MYDRVLKKLREKIRVSEFVMTLHAEEEMDADGLSIFDVEHCILSGRGRTFSGREMETIAKVGPTGKLVIIPVYLL